jgi:hypothetical protein
MEQAVIRIVLEKINFFLWLMLWSIAGKGNFSIQST